MAIFSPSYIQKRLTLHSDGTICIYVHDQQYGGLTPSKMTE